MVIDVEYKKETIDYSLNNNHTLIYSKKENKEFKHLEYDNIYNKFFINEHFKNDIIKNEDSENKICNVYMYTYCSRSIKLYEYNDNDILIFIRSLYIIDEYHSYEKTIYEYKDNKLIGNKIYSNGILSYDICYDNNGNGIYKYSKGCSRCYTEEVTYIEDKIKTESFTNHKNKTWFIKTYNDGGDMISLESSEGNFKYETDNQTGIITQIDEDGLRCKYQEATEYDEYNYYEDSLGQFQLASFFEEDQGDCYCTKALYVINSDTFTRTKNDNGEYAYTLRTDIDYNSLKPYRLKSHLVFRLYDYNFYD